ncbi:MAG: FAD-dependent oxidoreductase [Acidobacteriaceae bacterium]|nr:FAD-dependent oxidoreductase [Acidobacteriaceae bacterium]
MSVMPGFPGGEVAHLFYGADGEASGDTMNGELHVALDRTDFLAVFPLKGEGRARLIGTVREEAAQQEHEPLHNRTVVKVARGQSETLRGAELGRSRWAPR